jgi:hypothetical protein
MKIMHYALGAVAFRFLQKIFDRKRNGFAWSLTFGLQPLVEEDNEPRENTMDQMMHRMSALAMRAAESSDEQECRLCGETISWEPNAPRHQFALKLSSNDPGFEPFGAISFVHVRCARRLAHGFTQNEPVFDMTSPD